MVIRLWIYAAGNCRLVGNGVRDNAHSIRLNRRLGFRFRIRKHADPFSKVSAWDTTRR